MEPTIHNGELVIIKKGNVLPRRGDIILFRYGNENRGYFIKTHGEFGLVGYAAENRDYVKRVVDLPNDVVEIKENQLFINGKRVKETYIGKVKMDNFGPVKVLPGRVFVLGDNRDGSYDSRDFGPLMISQIKGMEKVDLYPAPTDLGKARGLFRVAAR